MPVCPSCDELQPIGGRWCSDCGVWLHHDGPTSALMRKRALDAARARGIGFRLRMPDQHSKTNPPVGEATSPTTGSGS